MIITKRMLNRGLAMNHNAVYPLIKKDIKRFFSDLSLFFSSFILPTILIIIMFMSLTMIISMVQKKTASKEVIVGITNPPEKVVSILEKYAIPYDDIGDGNPSDFYSFFEQKRYSVIIYFHADFIEQIRQFGNSDLPEVRLYYDQNNSDAEKVIYTLSAFVLPEYSQEIIASRITNADITQTFNVNYHKMGSSGKPIESFAGMVIPLMFLFLLTHSAVSLGVDLITSEKEKNTILGYLLMPIKRSNIAIAKCVSLIFITVVNAIFMMSMIILAIPVIAKFTLGETISSMVSLGLLQIASLSLVLVSTTILVTSIVCFISSLCKTTKVASGVSVVLYVLSIVSGFIAMFSDVLSISPILNTIPFVGNAVIIQRIVAGTYSISDIAVAVFSNIIVGACMIYLTSKQFESEKRMINI